MTWGRWPYVGGYGGDAPCSCGHCDGRCEYRHAPHCGCEECDPDGAAERAEEAKELRLSRLGEVE